MMYFYSIQNFVGGGVVIGQIHAPDLSIALNNSIFKPKENKLFFVNLSVKSQAHQVLKEYTFSLFRAKLTSKLA